MRKINAMKNISAVSEIMMESLLRGAIRNVFYQIDFVGEAKAKDCQVMLVRLTTNTDFPPDADVACLICFRPDVNSVDAATDADLRKITAGCELWYWRDKFWFKAVDALGVDYYAKIGDKKCYALYPVEVANGDALLGVIAR